ncbi:MAG: hypothetical protein OHK0045_03770 [Raineya sp.]
MEEIQNYWEEYNFNRLIPINLETFEELVLLFPILVVVSADKNIDGAEKNYYLEQLEKKSSKNEELNLSLLKAEVNYIVHNIEELYPLMIAALRIIVEKQKIENSLMDSMLAAAKVSYEPWQTKSLYAEYTNHLVLSKNLLDLIVEDVVDKKERVSEEEIKAIKRILLDTKALNERNKMILEVFGA